MMLTMNERSKRTSPELNPVNFNLFKNAPAPIPFVGHRPGNFARRIGASEEIIGRMPEIPFTRPALVDFVKANRDPEMRFVAVMSWGRMRHDHARKTLAVKERWIELIRALAKPQLTRAQAYALFRRARANPNTHLDGLGPAYFTKLLFFLRPVQDAYIMDQWTGKSVNLLFSDGATVRLNVGGVTDQNTETDYDQFCKGIEFVAEKLEVEPAQAEERLFSNGGRNVGRWRAHVQTCYSHDAQAR
jgi:hypothetical protein